MQTETMIVLGIAHLMIALLATIINVGVTQTRLSSTVSRDCRRFREAIRCEMTELLALYQENIDALQNQKGYFLSSRACSTIYKGNVARIITLPDPEIQPIVAAYAAAERLEHLVAATSKPSGAMAYKFIEGETPTVDLLAQIQSVRGKLRQALSCFDAPAESRGPARLLMGHRRRLLPASPYVEAEPMFQAQG